MDPLDHHLPPDLLAHGEVALALFFHGHAELFKGQARAAGHTGHGFIELGVGDAYAVAIRQLQLNALENESIECLAIQHFIGGHLDIPLLEVALNQTQALLQLARQNNVVVDDSGDLIDGLNLR